MQNINAILNKISGILNKEPKVTTIISNLTYNVFYIISFAYKKYIKYININSPKFMHAKHC